VQVDRAAAVLIEREDAGGAPRVLAHGLLRRPRLSPDARWVAFQAWQAASRSWDVLALERASGRVVVVASGPSNEVEPAWAPDGASLAFASDRRRGLGFTALYSAPFRPASAGTP
jgi:Tol biopolymer transport system component